MANGYAYFERIKKLSSAHFPIVIPTHITTYITSYECCLSNEYGIEYANFNDNTPRLNITNLTDKFVTIVNEFKEQLEIIDDLKYLKKSLIDLIKYIKNSFKTHFDKLFLLVLSTTRPENNSLVNVYHLTLLLISKVLNRIKDIFIGNMKE